jgi:hypothetical protein
VCVLGTERVDGGVPIGDADEGWWATLAVHVLRVGDSRARPGNVFGSDVPQLGKPARPQPAAWKTSPLSYAPLSLPKTTRR